MEKQRDKAAKRLQRKLERQQGGGGPEIEGETEPESGDLQQQPSEEQQA